MGAVGRVGAGDAAIYRANLESANRQKFVGAGLIILGGLTVVGVIAGSILAAKFGGDHNNVFNMGKNFTVSGVPGVSVSSTIGAVSIVGGAVLGLGLIGIGSGLVHNSRKKADKARKEFEDRANEVDTRKLLERSPGTNKKWAGAVTIGFASLLLVGAIAVIVLPKFTNMQAVNNMGPTFAAASGAHAVSFTAGAIGSLSAGVLSLALFGIGGALIAKGRKEAKERAEAEQDLIEKSPFSARVVGLEVPEEESDSDSDSEAPKPIGLFDRLLTSLRGSQQRSEQVV